MSTKNQSSQKDSMFDADKLHHAYVIEGESSHALSKVRTFLTDELNISLQGNIDVFERIYGSFGIADAREIKDQILQRSIGKYKIFILVMPSMTSASGNALLKSLEEPPKGTHFFIIVPNSKRLLDTLLSRVVLIKLESEGPTSNIIDSTPSKFVKSSRSKRLELVKKILDVYDKEKISKIEVIYFFKGVIEEYKKKDKYDHEALKGAIKSLDYMSDQSSSLKVLMEFISYTLA